MRKLLWAVVCVAVGAGIALGFSLAYRNAIQRKLPHLAEMEAACGRGGAAAHQAPPSVGAARCERYFGEVALVGRTARTQSALTGLIAAFILLVLRFRVYPLGGSRAAAHPGGNGRPISSASRP